MESSQTPSLKGRIYGIATGYTDPRIQESGAKLQLFITGASNATAVVIVPSQFARDVTIGSTYTFSGLSDVVTGDPFDPRNIDGKTFKTNMGPISSPKRT